MVRVAGIKAQVREGITERSPDGLTPSEQLVLINETVSNLAGDQQAIWRDLRNMLAEVGIVLIDGKDVTKAERTWIADHFLHNIFPLLTPLAIDPAHPFPFIPSLGFTIALHLARVSDGKPMNALIRMPGKIDRFIRLPTAEKDGRGSAHHALKARPACLSAGSFPATRSRGRAHSASSGIPNWKSRKRRRIWFACSRPH